MVQLTFSMPSRIAANVQHFLQFRHSLQNYQRKSLPKPFVKKIWMKSVKILSDCVLAAHKELLTMHNTGMGFQNYTRLFHFYFHTTYTSAITLYSNITLSSSFEHSSFPSVIFQERLTCTNNVCQVPLRKRWVHTSKRDKFSLKVSKHIQYRVVVITGDHSGDWMRGK